MPRLFSASVRTIVHAGASHLFQQLVCVFARASREIAPRASLWVAFLQRAGRIRAAMPLALLPSLVSLVSLVSLASLGVASCIPPPSELRAPVDQLVEQRLGQPIDRSFGGPVDRTADGPSSSDHRPGEPLGPATGLSAGELDALLARPLDASAAIRIALARSPRLRAAFDELDIAAGDIAAALGLGPVWVDGKLRFGRAYNDYELDAVQNLVGLVSAPRRRAAARADLAAARASAAAAVLRLAARVEIAFDDLLAAQADTALRQTAFDAADAAATVRERMYAAGNASDLAVARDRDAREQARLELGRTQATLARRREALAALLGLSGARTAWTTAGQLPDLPAAPPALDDLETAALAASLELTAGRERRTAADDRAADERLRTILPELGVGIAIDNDGHETSVGPALRIAIPLFDPRAGERARATALVHRADHQLDATSLELRAAARTARVTALATYQEARQLHDVVLPLRQQILDETVKHYNAMDADLFAVILARQGLVDAAHQQLDALRRHAAAMVEVTALSRGVMLDPPGSPADDR